MLINSADDVGSLVRALRKKMHLTQKDLALTAGTGLRFISDLEKGKPTCELSKTLNVLRVLGVKMETKLPVGFNSEDV